MSWRKSQSYENASKIIILMENVKLNEADNIITQIYCGTRSLERERE